ncbi:MAG: hypothetical protein ACLF0G_10895 [Candidatus Brocadiia bacterium]
MGVSSFEGIVENGRIRLPDSVRLPEKTRVYVVIPDVQPGPRAHVHSPRLAHREQASDFAKKIVEAPPDE